MMKLFKKYVILLLVYEIIIRFVAFYGLRLYYTFADNPKIELATIQVSQAIATSMQLALNVLTAILMLVDLKPKKLAEWLIILITFFNVEIGILLLLVWMLHREWSQKYETRQSQ